MTDETKMAAGEPVDTGAEPENGARRSRSGELKLLLVIAAGGVIGGLGRYGAGVWWPTSPGRFPWTTLGVNGLGCALIGVLLVLVTDVFTSHRLARPFLGTGVLGGFTTFSTYAVDSERLILTGHAGLGLANIAGTVVVAMVAVTAATRLSRRTVAAARR